MMKSVTQKVIEVEGEGFLALMDQRITVFGVNYIYTGKLAGVNATCILLEDAAIVYETGAFNDPKWKDAQALPKPVYIQIAAIESFTVLK